MMQIEINEVARNKLYLIYLNMPCVGGCFLVKMFESSYYKNRVLHFKIG